MYQSADQNLIGWPNIERHGWSHTGGRDWRSRIIYSTNIATSYAAGREAQIAAADRLGGRWSDDPPDGWANIDPKTGAPAGIDRGWGYAPGASLSVFSPPLRDDPPRGVPRFPPIYPDGGKAALAGKKCPGQPPRPRPFDPARLLPDGRSTEWYVSAFLDQFGATLKKPALFVDVNGDPLIVSDALFVDTGKSARAGRKVYKAMKRDRHRYMSMLADTLKFPQEKWDAWEYVAAIDETVRRVRYLAWWEIESDGAHGLSVFEWAHKRWWSGVTTFSPDGDSGFSPEEYMERQRSGILRWPK